MAINRTCQKINKGRKWKRRKEGKKERGKEGKRNQGIRE
jgi:hypothetical protein